MNPERSAMDYAILFALGIPGMFVAHLLGRAAWAMPVNGRVLVFWWAYLLVFPAMAAVWIRYKGTFWPTTGIVICLAPIFYFTWYAANDIQSDMGAHPYTVMFAVLVTTLVASYLAAARRKKSPTHNS